MRAPVFPSTLLVALMAVAPAAAQPSPAKTSNLFEGERAGVVYTAEPDYERERVASACGFDEAAARYAGTQEIMTGRAPGAGATGAGWSTFRTDLVKS